jgi:hypothetical protein
LIYHIYFVSLLLVKIKIMANSIEVKVDLVNEKFNIGDMDALTGALSVTVTAPDGTASAAITVPDAGDVDILFNSVVGWQSSNSLQRGVWTFTYVDGNAATGSVTFDFDSSTFSSHNIETVDSDGEAIIRDSVLSGNVDMSIDCFTSELTATDTTTYIIGGVTGSFTCTACTQYSNTIYAPPNVAPQTTVSNTAGASQIITPAYTGTYTAYLQGVAKWTYNETTSYVSDSNNHDVDVHLYAEVDGGGQVTIDCASTALCDVWECIRDINQKYKDVSCVNTREANKYKSKLERAMQLVTLAEQAVACGESTLMSTYIDEIKTITNCKTCS